MEVLLTTTLLFTLVLALSLIVERFLEILKAIYYILESRLNWYKTWTDRANDLRVLLEKRLGIFEYVDTKGVQSVLLRFRDMFLNENDNYPGILPVLSGDLVRAVTVKVGLKVVGVLLGIGLAIWLEIDLIEIWRKASGTSTWYTNISQNLRYILSGIALGAGTGPVHKIITTCERKREERTKKGVQ